MRMLRNSLITCCLVFCLSIASTLAQEAVYPTGTKVSVRYGLNKTTLAVGDTLIITRTLANSTSQGLTGLYFSDNFPAAFTVVGHSAKVNTSSITVSQTAPATGAVISGYQSITWLVDSPMPEENRHRSIAAKDSVTLIIKITCSASGSYTLPFHSTVCYNGSTGIFATSNVLSVTFTPSVDTTPPAAIIDLGDNTVYKEYRVGRRLSMPGLLPQRECDVAG